MQPGIGKLDRQRQADVAQADDADRGRTGVQSGNQSAHIGGGGGRHDSCCGNRRRFRHHWPCGRWGHRPAGRLVYQGRCRVPQAGADRPSRTQLMLPRFLTLVAALFAAVAASGATAAASSSAVVWAVAAGVGLVGAVRPAVGLMLVAAFAPLGGAIGALFGLTTSATEPLLLSVLAGWLLRRTLWRESWDTVGGGPGRSSGIDRLRVVGRAVRRGVSDRRACRPGLSPRLAAMAHADQRGARATAPGSAGGIAADRRMWPLRDGGGGVPSRARDGRCVAATVDAQRRSGGIAEHQSLRRGRAPPGDRLLVSRRADPSDPPGEFDDSPMSTPGARCSRSSCRRRSGFCLAATRRQVDVERRGRWWWRPVCGCRDRARR